MPFQTIKISVLDLLQLNFVQLRRVWIKIAFVLICAVGINGCDLYHLHYTDCRNYDGPIFDKSTLNRAILNQEYFDQVRISFDDDRHVDSISYQIETSGNLPPGIFSYRNNLNITFEGTATLQGTYSFAITVSARYKIYDRLYYDWYRDYCSYRTTQNYLLTVEPI